MPDGVRKRRHAGSQGRNPRRAHRPYLKGLKEIVVFIPAEDAIAMPTIEEMIKKRFMLKNPRGICITPPGYGRG
jgi:hypothetical protein